MIVSSKRLCVAAIALSCLGAAEDPRVPKFQGKSIPDPPRQKEGWTPPATKLPRFLVSATAALFEEGIADPRGCEYREVEIGDATIVKTRGFVLPQREGERGRFVVSWDGVVNPALSVGAVADLDKDIRTLAESMKRDRAAAAADNTNRFGNAGTFTGAFSRGGMLFPRGQSGVDSRSALKLCLLLRLGRADLAEVLFAAGTAWTPDVRGRDLTDYHISYVTLAADWAATVFIRLVGAHMRGDDAIALDAARRLAAFAKAVETKAEAMGFQRASNNLSNEPPSYLPFLRELPELLADRERRARETARGPIPKHGGDPSARIAALIRGLDQIDVRQMSSPGAANPGDSPLVRALIAEGDPAVEPLLSALETDMRLTRSVTYGRGMSVDRYVHPVFVAELAALEGILQTTDFGRPRRTLALGDMAARKELAGSIRVYWIKNRAISLNDRWYRALRDDAAGRDRWLEAAAGIVQATDDTRSPGTFRFVEPTRLRGPTAPPMKGEELRSRRAPSVSELLARRVADIARAGNPLSLPDIELHRACELAMLLERWDEKAVLPVARALVTQCREDIERKREQRSQPDQWLAGFVARLTMIRARGGEREALGEYAAWVRSCSPKELEHQSITCFEPMWTYRDDPAIAEAARWLFNDKQSPWVPLLHAPGGHTMYLFYDGNLYTSPLVRVAGFRDGMLAVMADRANLGTVRRVGRASLQYTLNDGGRISLGSSRPDVEAVKADVDLLFRICDYLASQVSSLDGAPECETYWPEDRRDRAVTACADFLKKYGDRFTADPPGGELDFPRGPRAHLAFPPLGRPATVDDVRAAKAIFSLEGQGETRLAKLPAFPIKARWIALKDFPVIRQWANGATFREYLQDGWIWQAEEVRKGDRWERSYGFVGAHVIARVPASEIELAPSRFVDRWGPLTGGLDARVDPIDPRAAGYEPGKPILLTVRIRNRRGVENAAPTEYLRRGGDGRPALRRGISLAAFYSAPGPPRTGQGQQGQREEELKPKWMDHFDPGKAARRLGPFDDFEAMRLDLNDWFDLTKRGSYRLRVVFAVDTGVGAGTSSDWYFTVGARDGSVP